MRSAAGYVGLSVVDTLLAAAGKDRSRRVTKPLLMPVLMRGRDRPTRRALALSGAGDVALLGESEAAFTAGLASFLGAQLAWIAALRSRPSAGLLHRRPVLAMPYVAAWAGLNAYLWPRAGRDRVPVVAYSTVLAAMALTALDAGGRAAVGGGLFMASDALLALDRFGGVQLPAHDGWVMATYTAAQALLAADGEDRALAPERDG